LITVDTFCYLSSPAHISDKKNYLIPPILFENQVYIIREKIFYEILNKIGLYQEFNLYIRENSYDNTRKWLSNCGLLNTGFLESVSNYNIETLNCKKIKNYLYFQKDCNGNPSISSEYLKNLLKKVFIYNYFKERSRDFNNYVCRELDIIDQELSNINNIANYNNRKNFYKNNLFSLLLENFLINIDNELLENLQIIESINIYTASRLNTKDLALYKIGNPVNCRNLKYKLTNITHQECLKNNTIFKIFIDFNDYSKNTLYKRDFVNILLDNMKTVTEDKFSFDMKYLNKLAISDRNCKTQNIPTKTLSFKEKNNEYQLPTLINVNFNVIKNSNLFLCSSDKINTLIAVLNMEKANLEKINSIIFDKKDSIESELVTLSLENDLIPYYTLCGYGKIHYN